MNTNARKSIELEMQTTSKAAINAGLDETQKQIAEYQASLLLKGFWRSCLNCVFWNDKDETKCLKYGELPPPNILVNGCRDWEDDIPF